MGGPSQRTGSQICRVHENWSQQGCIFSVETFYLANSVEAVIWTEYLTFSTDHCEGHILTNQKLLLEVTAAKGSWNNSSCSFSSLLGVLTTEMRTVCAPINLNVQMALIAESSLHSSMWTILAFFLVCFLVLVGRRALLWSWNHWDKSLRGCGGNRRVDGTDNTFQPRS